MSEFWRMLQLGDVVRIAEIPPEHAQDEALHADTRFIYEHLARTQRELVISRIDELNYPWTDFDYNTDDGRIEYHSLMLNHGGLELVSRKN